MEQTKKELSPKLDVVFQALFGEVGSERITKRFLENILERKIEEINLNQNQVLRKEMPKEKLGILDIIAKIDGKENCNIELQLIDRNNVVERMLFYWGKIYTKGIKEGEDYKKLQKTIVILIADYNLKETKEIEKYISKYKIMEEKERKVILTDKFEFIIIEMTKIKENEAGELMDWLVFLQNPNSERVKEKMETNKELREAKEKLDDLSEDEYMQRIADLRQKAIMDEIAIRDKGYDDGLEAGIREGERRGEKRGKGIGIIEGKAIGIEEGKAIGKKEKQIEIAKKMLKLKMPIEQIEEITGLSKNEIMSI